MKKLSVIAMLAASVVATNVQARDVSWNYLQISHNTLKVDEIDDNMKGYAGEFSRAFDNNVIIGAEVSTLSIDKYGVRAESNAVSAKVGYFQAFAGQTQWYAQVGAANQFDHSKSSFAGKDSSTSVYLNARAGVVGMATDALQLNGFVEYRNPMNDAYDSDLWVGAQARFFVKESVSLQATYAKESDLSMLSLGVAYHF